MIKNIKKWVLLEYMALEKLIQILASKKSFIAGLKKGAGEMPSAFYLMDNLGGGPVNECIYPT